MKGLGSLVWWFSRAFLQLASYCTFWMMARMMMHAKGEIGTVVPPARKLAKKNWTPISQNFLRKQVADEPQRLVEMHCVCVHFLTLHDPFCFKSLWIANRKWDVVPWVQDGALWAPRSRSRLEKKKLQGSWRVMKTVTKLTLLWSIYHTLFSTFILSQLEYENWPSPRCYSDLVSDIAFCLKLNGHWMNEHFLPLFYLVSAWCSQTKWFSFLLDSQAHYITLFIHVRLTFNAKRFSNQSNTKRSLTDPVTQTEKNDPRTSYSKL